MPAATPHLYFQTLCQHEVFRVISLLTTELSSYKMCKVGMLFCTLQASI